MAFNPSQKVAAAREIGRRFSKDIVIVLMINTEAETLEYASYGATELLCQIAKRLADISYDAIIKYFNIGI